MLLIQSPGTQGNWGKAKRTYLKPIGGTASIVETFNLTGGLNEFWVVRSGKGGGGVAAYLVCTYGQKKLVGGLRPCLGIGLLLVFDSS